MGTLPDEAFFDHLVDTWVTEAGVDALLTQPCAGVEAVRRGDVTVVVNHTARTVEVPLADGPVAMAPFDVRLTGS